MANNSTNPGLKWLLFSFKGRIARQSFALSVGLQLVLLTLVLYQAVQAGENESRLAFSGLLFLIILPIVFWSMAAITIKRLHDLNLPAALAILLFIPAINWITFFFLMLKSSHPDSNEHGPPPFGGTG